jgi:hypothetical protein
MLLNVAAHAELFPNTKFPTMLSPSAVAAPPFKKERLDTDFLSKILITLPLMLFEYKT